MMTPEQTDQLVTAAQIVDEYTRELDDDLIDLRQIPRRLAELMPAASHSTIVTLTMGVIVGFVRFRALVVDTASGRTVDEQQQAIQEFVAQVRAGGVDSVSVQLALARRKRKQDGDPPPIEIEEPWTALVAGTMAEMDGITRELDVDYEGLFSLSGGLRYHLPAATDDQIIEVAHAILVALQRTGVIAVDPTSFEPWPDQTDFPAEIIRQWRALGRDPRLPDIAWLERPEPAPNIAS